jgi:hypothetical protein
MRHPRRQIGKLRESPREDESDEHANDLRQWEMTCPVPIGYSSEIAFSLQFVIQPSFES